MVIGIVAFLLLGFQVIVDAQTKTVLFIQNEAILDQYNMIVSQNEQILTQYNTLTLQYNDLVKQFNDLQKAYNELVLTMSTGSGHQMAIIYSIHSTITIKKGNETILEEYHAGALTQMGMNFTLANIVKNSTGTPSYNATYYTNNLNLSFVSIGNAYATWACNSSEVLLPGEWNRTLGTQHDFTYNSFNVTAIFYPDTGPYTADCISLNFEDGIGNDAQWGYDTFSEVTGIDDTFTITIEIKVSVS